jgi:hypothetical protein
MVRVLGVALLCVALLSVAPCAVAQASAPPVPGGSAAAAPTSVAGWDAMTGTERLRVFRTALTRIHDYLARTAVAQQAGGQAVRCLRDLFAPAAAGNPVAGPVSARVSGIDAFHGLLAQVRARGAAGSVTVERVLLGVVERGCLPAGHRDVAEAFGLR